MTHFSPIHPQSLFLNREDAITPVKREVNDSYFSEVNFYSPTITPTRNLYDSIQHSCLLTPSKAYKVPLSSPQYIDALISEKVTYAKHYIKDELSAYLSNLDNLISRSRECLSEKEAKIREKRHELEMLQFLEKNEITLFP